MHAAAVQRQAASTDQADLKGQGQHMHTNALTLALCLSRLDRIERKMFSETRDTVGK